MLAKPFSSIPDRGDPLSRRLGSNAASLRNLVWELNDNAAEAERVHVALYLFNNLELYNSLKSLASRGVAVTLTSIPLGAYEGGKEATAKEVYDKALADGAIAFRVFPHVYRWIRADYVRGEGGLPYSLHIKAALVEYRTGLAKLFLSSGNLAVEDGIHSETSLSITDEGRSPYIQPALAFFQRLESASRPYAEYLGRTRGLSKKLGSIFDFTFCGSCGEVDAPPADGPHAFFTAPFLTSGGAGSNHSARAEIIRLIDSAKERVWVCTQHLHDVDAFDGYAGRTITQALMDARARGVEVRAVKQSTSSGLVEKRRAAFTECHFHYGGIQQRHNPIIHDKFILADGAALVTTSNLTATNFGWGAREMELEFPASEAAEVKRVILDGREFFGVPGTPQFAENRKGTKITYTKTDTFSEVNAFAVVEDKPTVEYLERHFKALWGSPSTKDVEILR